MSALAALLVLVMLIAFAAGLYGHTSGSVIAILAVPAVWLWALPTLALWML